MFSSKKKAARAVTIAVSAFLIAAIPVSIIAYSSKDVDKVNKASNIVEVESVNDNDTTEVIVKSTNTVDEDIASVLGLNTTTSEPTEDTGVTETSTSTSATSTVKSTTTAYTSTTEDESNDAGENNDDNGNVVEGAVEDRVEAAAVKVAAVAEETKAVKSTTSPSTTTVVTSTADEVTTEAVETTESREYIVYKPGTHYVHKNTCKWVDDTCYEIENTEDIEARICEDCNPDIEIVNEYIEETAPANSGNAISVSDSDYILLCNCVAHEAGSDWITAYNKALVVEVIMNRVNSSAYPDTIYGVITQNGQFSGCWNYANLGTYSSKVTDLVKEGVDMYLNDPDSFNHGYTGFWGDGSQNHFH